MADAIKYIQGEWKFFKDARMVPVTKEYKPTLQNWAKGRVNKNGEGDKYTDYLSFPLEWYEQDHWAYRKKDGVWYVYRVYMKDGTEVDRKLCASDVGEYKPEAILARIKDRVYSVSTEQRLSDTQSYATKTIRHSDYEVRFSDLFDGKHILALCAWKPKMTFGEIKMVLDNEGATVDAQGIIHKK